MSRRFLKRVDFNFDTKITTTVKPQENLPKGFPGFLSAASADLLRSAYRQHLRAVSELAFGTAATVEQAQRELFRIVEAVEREEAGRLKNPRLWYHASQAWNLEFFLRGLTETESNPSDSIIKILSRDFGSFDNFKRIFQSHASAMIGCGWIWLVKSNGNSTNNSTDSKLKILTTFNGATPLFKSSEQPLGSSRPPLSRPSAISSVKNSPILGLNLWESAFVLDYGLDRDAYIYNWWRAVNWNVVSVLLSK